jgi:GntR family transcriptional repressor for pyruvate dehydrogenase complex
VKGGPVIENTMLGRMAALFLDAFRFHRLSLDDFTAVRKGIELSALETLFLNAEESDIENLRESIRRAKEKLDRNESVFEENIDFHRQLAKATRNYLFVIIVESILAVLSDFRSRLTGIGREVSLDVVMFHEKILNAIAEGNKEEARALLEEDLTKVNRNLVPENAIHNTKDKK